MSMNKGMYTSNSCEWETPVDILESWIRSLVSTWMYVLRQKTRNAPDITPKRMTGWKKNGPASAG